MQVLWMQSSFYSSAMRSDSNSCLWPLCRLLITPNNATNCSAKTSATVGAIRLFNKYASVHLQIDVWGVCHISFLHQPGLAKLIYMRSLEASCLILGLAPIVSLFKAKSVDEAHIFDFCDGTQLYRPLVDHLVWIGWAAVTKNIYHACLVMPVKFIVNYTAFSSTVHLFQADTISKCHI